MQMAATVVTAADPDRISLRPQIQRATEAEAVVELAATMAEVAVATTRTAPQAQDPAHRKAVRNIQGCRLVRVVPATRLLGPTALRMVLPRVMVVPRTATPNSPKDCWGAVGLVEAEMMMTTRRELAAEAREAPST